MAPLVAKDTKPQLFSDMMWNDLLRDHSDLMNTIFKISQESRGDRAQIQYIMVYTINSTDLSGPIRRALVFWANTLPYKSFSNQYLPPINIVRQIVVCKQC